MAEIKVTSKERYASTDEMKAEFGDYRVNNGTQNLSDSTKGFNERGQEVFNDPFTEEASNDTHRGFKVGSY